MLRIGCTDPSRVPVELTAGRRRSRASRGRSSVAGCRTGDDAVTGERPGAVEVRGAVDRRGSAWSRRRRSVTGRATCPTSYDVAARRCWTSMVPALSTVMPALISLLHERGTRRVPVLTNRSAGAHASLAHDVAAADMVQRPSLLTAAPSARVTVPLWRTSAPAGVGEPESGVASPMMVSIVEGEHAGVADRLHRSVERHRRADSRSAAKPSVSGAVFGCRVPDRRMTPSPVRTRCRGGPRRRRPTRVELGAGGDGR